MLVCFYPPPRAVRVSAGGGKCERGAWLGVPGARVAAAATLLLLHELEECSGLAPRSRDVSAFSSLTVAPYAHTPVT